MLCSLAGYGFARLQFRGRDFGFLAIIATIMIPTQLLMIPTYIMFSRLGLIDTLAAAFVPWLASAFGIFLMRQFFLSIPVELEEAAALDGASKWQTFLRIVLPLARPALATLAIFTLLGAWNDLIWPLVAINKEGLFTIQLGHRQLPEHPADAVVAAHGRQRRGDGAADPVLPGRAEALHRDHDDVGAEGMRVLVAGDANLDLVLRGDVVPRFGQAEQLLDSADLVLGSSAGICASGLARLGADVALVARVGADVFGDRTARAAGGQRRRHRRGPAGGRADRGLRDPLRRRRPGHPHPHRGDGRTHRCRRAGSASFPEPASSGPAAAHLHVASYFLLPGLADGPARRCWPRPARGA